MRTEPGALRDMQIVGRFVEREVVSLYHHKAIYNELRTVLIRPDQGALRFGHFFFQALGAWYTTQRLVTLRALTETSRRSAKALSLIGLLSRVRDSGEFSDAERKQCSDGIDVIREEAAQVYAATSQSVAHRDPGPPYATVDENEIYRLLDIVRETLDRALRIVFKPNYERLVIDVDPYWARNLFSFAWGLPSEDIERLSLGRDAYLVLEKQRRDFTESSVFARRPTDDELAIYGVTREEFERLRDAQYSDPSERSS